MPIVTQAPQLPTAEEARQPSTNEAAPEVVSEVVTEPQEEQLSPKFAALARREKALRSKWLQKEAELKAKEDSLNAKFAEYESSYVPKSSIKERLEKDPLGFITENGLTYDQLTQQALNPQEVMIQKLEAKIAALESKTNESLTKAEEHQKKAYEQAVNQIRTEVKVLIDSDPAFETIKETDNAEAVVELIRETFDKEGVLLSHQEAAEEVETYLIEQGEKMARLKKVQQKLAPQPQAEEKLAEPQKSHPMKTLTHATVAAASKPLSAMDRIERAKLAFKGQLK